LFLIYILNNHFHPTLSTFSQDFSIQFSFFLIPSKQIDYFPSLRGENSKKRKNGFFLQGRLKKCNFAEIINIINIIRCLDECFELKYNKDNNNDRKCD